MQVPEMMRAKGDGIEIQTAVWRGKDPTVLCIHGLTANCRCWDVIADRLAPAHRVVAVDLRGRGMSDKPATGYSSAHHVRDLIGVLDDLGLERVVLLGHSLGGYIGLEMAAGHPERVAGLIMMDAGAELSQDHWDRVDAAIRPAVERLDKVFPSVEAFLDLMRQAPFLQPWSDTLDTYFRYDLTETADGVRSRIRAAHIQEEMRNKRRSGSARYFKKVTCPVLVLRATDGILSADDILLPEAPLQEMLDEIPSARCVDLPGTNHYSIVFQPNAARDRAVRDFMTKL